MATLALDHQARECLISILARARANAARPFRRASICSSPPGTRCTARHRWVEPMFLAAKPGGRAIDNAHARRGSVSDPRLPHHLAPLGRAAAPRHPRGRARSMHLCNIQRPAGQAGDAPRRAQGDLDGARGPRAAPEVAWRKRPRSPAQDEDFALSHCNTIQAMAFPEHFKLPLCVDFQAELEFLRCLRRKADEDDDTPREAAE